MTKLFKTTLAAVALVATATAAHALNPQPLPPRVSGAAVNDGFSSRALNPQPLPPKESGFQSGSFSNRMLNPQPLPPRFSNSRFGGR
jgi:hypothetical protein